MHKAANALSRLPTKEEDRTPLVDDLSILAVNETENEEDVCVIYDNCQEFVPLKGKAEPSLMKYAPLSEEEVVLKQVNI